VVNANCISASVAQYDDTLALSTSSYGIILSITAGNLQARNLAIVARSSVDQASDGSHCSQMDPWQTDVTLNLVMYTTKH
jgi:hypothetical protein